MELVINLFKDLFEKIDYLQEFGTVVYLGSLLVVGIVFCYGGFIVFRIIFWMLGAFVGAFYAGGTAESDITYIIFSILGTIVGTMVFALIFAFGIGIIGASFGFMVGFAFENNTAMYICIFVGAVVSVKLTTPFVILMSSYVGALAMSFAYYNSAQYFENGQLFWTHGIAYYGRFIRKNLVELVTMNANMSQFGSELWFFIMVFATGILIQGYLYYKRTRDEDLEGVKNWV